MCASARKASSLIRERAFNRIDITADTHEETLRRLHAGFDPKPFYTGIYNARSPPIPKGFTVDMKVELERLRLECLLSEPSPPQYDLTPRQS